MRGKTASRTFQAKKEFDVLLASLLPDVYLLVCTTCLAEAARRRMVTLTRIP
jgi:hypothetical protein